MNFPPEAWGGRSAGTLVPGSTAVPSLNPSGYCLGPMLTIINFCTQYQLKTTTQSLLVAEDFTDTDAFEYTTVDALVTMGLKTGAIAQLRAAIAKWALSAADKL
jgi:hypothetical protein